MPSGPPVGEEMQLFSLGRPSAEGGNGSQNVFERSWRVNRCQCIICCRCVLSAFCHVFVLRIPSAWRYESGSIGRHCWVSIMPTLLRDRHVPIFIPTLQSRPRLPHAMLGITSVYLLSMNICRKLVMKVVAGLSD